MTPKHPDNEPIKASEPVAAYRAATSTSPSDAGFSNPNPDWNPNYPVHATQEEWWEHIHEIEQGPFYPIKEVHQKVEQWLNGYPLKK